MKKTKKKHGETYFDSPALDGEPSGGCATMWLVGVGIALVPLIYGVYCLSTGHAILMGETQDLDVRGDAAFALAISYMAVGLFIHAYWFWGLHPRLSFLSKQLQFVALVIFLASFGFGICKILI